MVINTFMKKIGIIVDTPGDEAGSDASSPDRCFVTDKG